MLVKQEMKPQLWITQGMWAKARLFDQECADAQAAQEEAQAAYEEVIGNTECEQAEKAQKVALRILMSAQALSVLSFALREAFKRTLLESFSDQSNEHKRRSWLDAALENVDKLSAQTTIQLLVEKHDLVCDYAYGDWEPRWMVMPDEPMDEDLPPF